MNQVSILLMKRFGWSLEFLYKSAKNCYELSQFFSMSNLIPYKLSNAVTQLSTLFLSNSDIFNHGCWCSKLTHHSNKNLGGKVSIDGLDEICKSWAKARRCLRSENQSCESSHFQKLSDFYEINENSGFCLDEDACLYDACEIDYYFIQEINSFIRDNNITIIENPNCTERSGGSGNQNCEGYLASELIPPVTTTINLDLILEQNGLNMTDKQLYISLVWSVPCDLDLHVYEPDGFEIAWYNMTSDLGGTMDIDYWYLEQNQTAIENISWQEQV